METYYVDVGVRLAVCDSRRHVQSFSRVGSHGVSGFALRSRTIYPRLAFWLAVHRGGAYVLICLVCFPFFISASIDLGGVICS